AARYQAQVDQFWGTMGITASTAPSTPAGTSPSAVGSSSPRPIADRLQDLARLHANGVLTDDEFAAAKRNVLEE
ncbi:MAG: SHOCT domain-containing protein, partial [Chloroflexota bacterium]